MSEENIQKVMDMKEDDTLQPQELQGVHELHGLGLGRPSGSNQFLYGSTEEEDKENRKKFAERLRKYSPKTAEKDIKAWNLE